MQRCGSEPEAGVSTADVITALGTGKPELGSAARAAHDAAGVTGVPIDVVRVTKPSHCPTPSPLSAQLGPRKWVGWGELALQCRFPPISTRLMSEAVVERLS